MPVLKFLFNHKKFTVLVSTMIFAIVKFVVLPAQYVGFKNYPKAIKKFTAINKSYFSVDAKRHMKLEVVDYYHNRK